MVLVMLDSVHVGYAVIGRTGLSYFGSGSFQSELFI